LTTLITMKNRIVILGSFSDESVAGGITTHCTRLLARLKTICPVAKINVRPKICSLKTFFIATPLFWLLCVLILLAKGFRIFHFHTSSRSIPFILLAPVVKILGGKNIISFHSGKIGSDLEKNNKNINLFRYVFLFADAVVFMNENEAAILAKRFPRYAPKIKVAHSFIFPAQQPPVPVRTDNEFHIASMGAWLRHYSFEDVIAGATTLANEHPAQKFRLTLVAALFNIDFAYKTEIHILADKTNAEVPNLEVVAAEEIQDTLAFFADIDVLVRSSTVDSFGLCVAEAEFCGKPVIATNVCRRPTGTFLYTPHDLPALTNHLRELFLQIQNKTLPKIILDPSEDAFQKIFKIYKEI